MTKTPAKTLEEIVREARTLPPDVQLRFLREACSADIELYESAMQEMQSRQRWFDSGVESDLRASGQRHDATGERIGSYRIVRSLGEGGMGEVFLADRVDEQFKQQVAIKVVRHGLASRHVEGRLRLERQILATLDHPNIARFLDGGATDDGTPYIVMEYVDGEPIDSYCDRRNLSIDARLRLFRVVCSAVHRAHQNLVVHRDLKPSNILVTKDGVPKLLDFGIAKILDDRQMMHTMAVTHADYRMMTPDHASPEQIRGDVITTASDIYVLGVLLYELLSGLRPFHIAANRLPDLERAICEDEPIPPSIGIGSGITSDPQGIEQIAADRGATVPKLKRTLRGDLDNIVLMAMRKEPERRYASAEQFAADIDHYLEGLPVRARADAWSYRAAKFVRRHAVVVGLSAAFLAILIGFTVTTYLQARRIEAQAFEIQQKAHSIQEQANLIALENEGSRWFSQVLIDSFDLADPRRSRGERLSAKDILDRGRKLLVNNPGLKPELLARVLDSVGRAYLGLGLTSDAEPLITRAFEMRTQLPDPERAGMADSYLNMGKLAATKNKLDLAEQHVSESLRLNERLGGAVSSKTADSLCELGMIQMRQGKLDPAAHASRRCLAIRESLAETRSELLTGPRDTLARIAQQQADFAVAERLYREALEIDGRADDGNPATYVFHLNNLATAIQEQGRLDEAQALFDKSLPMYQEVLGEKHPETVAAMSTYGRFLISARRYGEAREVLGRALVLHRQLAQEEGRSTVDLLTGYDLASLARIDFEQRKYADAERRLKEALAVYPQSKAASGYVFVARTLLARTLIGQNELDRALAVLENDVAAAATVQDQQWITRYAAAAATYGRALALAGRGAEAEPALVNSYLPLRESKRVADRQMGEVVRGWIHELYVSQQRPDFAQKYAAPARP